MCQITNDLTDTLVSNLDFWTGSSPVIDDIFKGTDIKFDHLKFIKFCEKIQTLLSSIKGVRGINLDYLIRDEVHEPGRADTPDVSSLEFMRLNTTFDGLIMSEIIRTYILYFATI